MLVTMPPHVLSNCLIIARNLISVWAHKIDEFFKPKPEVLDRVVIGEQGAIPAQQYYYLAAISSIFVRYGLGRCPSCAYAQRRNKSWVFSPLIPQI